MNWKEKVVTAAVFVSSLFGRRCRQGSGSKQRILQRRSQYGNAEPQHAVRFRQDIYFSDPA